MGQVGFRLRCYVWYDISCTREQQQSFYLFRDLHVIWGFQVNRRENPVFNGKIFRTATAMADCDYCAGAYSEIPRDFIKPVSMSTEDPFL